MPVKPLLHIDTIVANQKMSGHFTVSAVVIALGHILLVDHKKIGAWLPPGGHINPIEMPHEAAIREVYEETGVGVKILSEEVPITLDSEAMFPPQPLCLHTIKARENGVDVYHFDLAYLAQVDIAENSLPNIYYSQEVKEARWFRLEEVGDTAEITLARNVPELIALAKSKLKLLNL